VTRQQVIPAGPADAAVLAEVVAEAFHDLAPSRWLIEDPAARREIFPGYFRVLVEHALASGTVHTTAELTAVALWLPAGHGGPHLPEGYSGRLADATRAWAQRFAAFDAALERHHPAATGHHHLAILAVHPACQGQGIGTELLNAHHATLDATGTPAYLEAPSPRNRDFYRRHGYAPLPGAPFRLPDGGPPMWPMWRLPHRHK
jgi:GNAT superfamily N-acetyltransferase